MSEPAVWIRDFTLPSDLHAAEQTVAAVTGELERRGWPHHDVFGVHLALEEAVVNAIEHGNRSDPAKQVYVRCEIHPATLIVLVRDEGPGFDVATVPDPTAVENLDKPSGRGIMLIRSFMSDAQYLGCGNELRMVKQRASGAPTPE
jgi:serine/threonine-protein kinase RsbW